MGMSLFRRNPPVTATPGCRCGHGLQDHRHVYDLFSACNIRACRCTEFICRDCGEVAGLHTANCQHQPRHKWDKPSQTTPGEVASDRDPPQEY